MTAMRRPGVTAWLMLLPMISIVLVVTGYPFLRTIWLSFNERPLVGLHATSHWVGLDNFDDAFTDPDFGAALWRTLYFTLGSVSIEVVLGVLVALLLNEAFRGRVLVRALLVLPLAMPTIVSAMMWRIIFDPQFGSLNALLTQLHIISAYRSWLGDPGMAMNMVIVADVWKNYPLVAVIVLAALQIVPKDVFEAAVIDGAGAIRRFWTVTFPVLLPPLSVAIVLRTIDAFKVFDIIYIMTRGGPADSTKTASFFVYDESFAYLEAGSGAAYALIVVAISMVLIAVYLTAIRRQEKP
jgi:multiple sugar transport system permease protein